jgi:F0F1-type ATP synthase epsilon subunit
MARDAALRLRIRTPHADVLDRAVDSVRVPTETGQVGLRARREAVVLVVEPGLLVVRAGASVSFAATAGGMLRVDGDGAELLTPFAVVGSAADAVVADLERQRAAPDSELAARRRLGELEERIMHEVARRRSGDHGARALEGAP